MSEIMMKFKVKALDQKGSDKSFLLEGADEKSVISTIREEGYYPFEVTQVFDDQDNSTDKNNISGNKKTFKLHKAVVLTVFVLLAVAFCNQVNKRSTPTESTDTYFKDSKGNVISEIEAEKKLTNIRKKVQSMPDSLNKSFSEGMLKELENEWQKIKMKGLTSLSDGRYYKDFNGNIISERKMEKQLQEARSNMTLIPDGLEKIEMEMQLRELENQWILIKNQGPISE